MDSSSQTKQTRAAFVRTRRASPSIAIHTLPIVWREGPHGPGVVRCRAGIEVCAMQAHTCGARVSHASRSI